MKLKKYLYFILSTILCITSLLMNSTNIYASSRLTIVSPFGAYPGKWSINFTQAGNWGGYDDYYAQMYIDGQKVYCVEPLANVFNGYEYDVGDLPSFVGGDYKASRLGHISALGYGFNGDTSHEMDYATQIRIWQEIIPGVVDTSTIHPDIQAKIDEINNRLWVMDTDVSFNRSNIVLHGYGRENGQTLVDENGCFAYYNDYSVEGIHTERNGNELTIWAEPGDESEVDLIYDCLYFRSQVGTSIAYSSPSSQNVAYLQAADPRALILNVQLQIGSIQIQKQDQDATRAQGDATLQGATFDVIDNLTNEVIGTLISDESGMTNRIENLSTDRTYTIHETKAPNGYVLGEDKIVDFSILGNDPIIEYNEPFHDRIKSGSIQIEKVITSGEKSEIVKPEENAEFEIVLKRYVDQYGSIEEALKHTDEMTSMEYAHLVTNEKGIATINNLAYGVYMVKQTKGEENTNMLKDMFEVSLLDDGQKQAFIINNIPTHYYIQIVKKDKATNETISASSASFKIKDEKGNVVQMKVGNKMVDTFVTTSDQGLGFLSSLKGNLYYAPEDAKGSVMTPLWLPAGKYTLEEIQSPESFLKGSEIEFEVSKDYVQESKDEDQIITLEVINEHPVGTLKVHKTIDQNKADTSLVKNNVEGIEFTLLANENIISKVNGKQLYKKGDAVGVYKTDRNGDIHVSNIELGRYILKETKTHDGLVLDQKEYKVNFEKKDDVTKEIIVEYSISNKATLTSFSKTDVTGQEELEGATLTVYDKENHVVDTWVSTNKKHVIEGLKPGNYRLEESIAIDGYVKASDVEFKVLDTDKVQHVEMVDKIVDVSKVDLGGKEVEGASIQVFDQEGNVVDEWISTKDVHRIKNLEEGKSYTLHEDVAPAGYELATDIEFKVGSKRENMHIEMIDKKLDSVSITKYDATNKKELPGAKLKVCDEDGNIIDEWTSTKEAHIIENLYVGQKYVLTEIAAPEKYAIAKSIEFVVEDNGEVLQKVEMFDELQSVVHTRVMTHHTYFGMAISASLIGMIFCVIQMKKKN